jgi:inosose dehydratase
MSNFEYSRRGFLKGSLAAGVGVFTTVSAANSALIKLPGHVHLATNQYPWQVFYGRDKRNFGASLDSGLGEVASSGLDGFEPLVTTPQQIDKLAPLLKKRGLKMRSLYVNSVLHDVTQANKSIQFVLAVAERARKVGTKIIVTNPSPIRWGGAENKTDAELVVQGKALQQLGIELKGMGLVLAYHNHDIELRHAAREFHHMMAGTSALNVKLCLDAHWIYRGAGNSQVALFDIMKLYGTRIVELHLRQSKGGIWTETFCEGDIDYGRVAKYLQTIRMKPHIVLEQAIEAATPKTMSPVAAHKKSCRYARRVFKGF